MKNVFVHQIRPSYTQLSKKISLRQKIKNDGRNEPDLQSSWKNKSLEKFRNSKISLEKWASNYSNSMAGTMSLIEINPPKEI